MDNTRSLCDLLKHHKNAAEEISDMQQIATEAEQGGNFGAFQYFQSQIEAKRASLRDMVYKIRVRVKGRLVRPTMVNQVIYEISDYNEETGQLELRRMFDPNGILLAKTNTLNSFGRTSGGSGSKSIIKCCPKRKNMPSDNAFWRHKTAK